MLPLMLPMEKSRTKRARMTKSFEQVRIGPVRLYFSHFEFIGFQLDGEEIVVSVPPKRKGIDDGHFIEGNRRVLEPDESKWLSKTAFEQKWENINAKVFC